MPLPFWHRGPPNMIKTIVENPCDAPWMLYVETLLPAAGKALLTIASFGMDDVVRGAFRPRAKRSSRHRRKGRKGRRVRFNIPEFGNMIGSKIMVVDAFPTRQVSQGVKHLWIVDGVLQKGLWFWLVFDVIDTFLYEWSSLIVQSKFCDARFQQKMNAVGTGGALLGILDWQAMLCPTIKYITSGMTWNVSTGRVPAGKFMIITTVFAINTGFTDQTVQLRISHVPPQAEPIDLSEPLFIQEGFSGKLLAAGVLDGPARYLIEWRNDSGGTSGFFSAVYAIQLGP